MQIHAAVVTEPSGAFEVAGSTLADPRPSEVLVRVAATGPCRTDLHVRDQPCPLPLPAVFGHEGAGAAERVGAGVRGLASGDRVVLPYPSAGPARPAAPATPLAASTATRHASAARGWTAARHRPVRTACRCAVTSPPGPPLPPTRSRTPAMWKVGDDVLLGRLGPRGCGFRTGAGAVLDAAEFRPGAGLAMSGAGAAGLTAVMTGVIAGARRTVARALDAGTVRIDGWAALSDQFEEGGAKRDGQGRMRGLAVPDDFVEHEHVAFVPAAVAGSVA